MGPNRLETEEIQSPFQTGVLASDSQPKMLPAGHAKEDHRRLELLRDVGRKAASAAELPDLIDQVLQMTEQTLKCSASSVLLIDHEKEELFFQFVRGPAQGVLQQATLGTQSGIAGWVARNGKPVMVNDVSRDERFCKDIDEITGFNTRSILCAPLVSRGKVLGVIEVLNKSDGSDFGEHDLRTLETVASTAAMAIDLKRAEEALRASQEHYSALVGSLADAVFKFRDGAIEWCNDRVEEVLGYPKSEVVGNTTSAFFPRDSALSVFSPEVSAAMRAEGVFRGLTKFQRKDGQLVDIEYCLSRIQNRQPVELVAVVRDITERKRAEEALSRSEEYFRSLIENAQVGKGPSEHPRVEEALGDGRDPAGVRLEQLVYNEDTILELLGVNRNTLSDLRRYKRFPYVSLTTRVRVYLADDIRAWLQKRTKR